MRTPNLERVALVFGLAFVADGAHMLYQYFEYRSVNSISLAFVIVAGALSAVALLLILAARILDRLESRNALSPETKKEPRSSTAG